MPKEKTREYLERALKEAKAHLLPWQYALIHQAAMSSAGGQARARILREAAAQAAEAAEASEETEKSVVKAVFVCDEPSSLEAVRGQGLVGPDGVVFLEKYLEPMGLTRDDIYIAFDSDPEILKTIDVPCFALGKAARESVGEFVDCVFPHPAAIRKRGDSGEVARKVRKAVALLDAGNTIGKNDLRSRFEPSQESAETLSTEIQSGAENLIKSNVAKTLAPLQIVYGVVLDPYQFDLQGDWIPPMEVERTAIDFMKFSRELGFEHNGRTTAQVVESTVMPYPTPEDREKAFANKPHRVLKSPYGSDMVHSGSWVIGAHLSNELWALYNAGEIDAFSIGGQGVREPATESDMPEIEVIEVSYA